ncbi:MAG TPA: carboxypeptidase regulatory-like domain-containing protein [Terracidiphilus sp.]|nr:carboxypeptidase regulatory-like domain-containing protein [Terracidiphilus sp.]
MRFIRLQNAAMLLGLFATAGLMANLGSPTSYAQSNISGDIAGSVVDPSGAAIASAEITVTSQDQGVAKTVLSDRVGGFRVSLLSPGKYSVIVKATGFKTAKLETTISVGVVTPLAISLTVGQATTTVEVTASSVQVLHVDDAQLSTTFDFQQIQTLPNPGNDLTFVAQTAPGAVMNTQGGYGNFSTDGLPATSNTFTVNGGYEGDPYLNLNNSGATNLLLGNNDVESVTVITNSYDAAFGGLGGAQVNEISRSGSNKWHGNLAYWWNGRAMNANSYFNKQAGSPRNFDNANQWAAAIGGPIKKDKIFGFIDNEGIRVIIPVRGKSYGPSPSWQSLILGAPTGCPNASSASVRGRGASRAPRSALAINVCDLVPYGNLADNGNSGESAVYQAIFNYYNHAPNWAQGAVDPADPDTWIWNGQTTNFGREWLINGRVDFNLSANDHLYIHFKDDHGTQPTQTSFLDPVFDAQSPQPSYEGQLNYTRTLTPNVVNQFLFGASYYRAIFTNTNAAKLAATNVPFVLIPEAFATSGDWDITLNSSTWVGGADYAFPQGRNVTGYQFTDDLSWTRGKHNFKFGYAFRRDDITDYTASERNINFAGPENIILDPGSFAAGFTDEYLERFPKRLSQPVAMYVSGWYGQDQWKPMPGLTLTLGLRMEHNSNPLCLTSCVSNYADDFAKLPTATSTPYNTLFVSRRQAFLAQQDIAWEPRFGFSFLPGGPSGKTTIRGGFGMFADYFPAQIMGDVMTNLPTVDRFTVLGYATAGALVPLDLSAPNSGHAQAVTSNNALTSLYSQGACYKGCAPNLSLYNVTGGVFSRPTAIGTARKVFLPTYEEWSFAVERELRKNTALAVNYVGNRSYHQPVQYLPNAYDPYGTNASLPASRPNAALGQATVFYNGSYSNFNGLITTLTSRMRWLTTHINYAYGHALDTTSNGGFDTFGINPVSQINPHNLRQQYGNADYDTRHYISANYAIAVPYYHGPKALTADWEIAGTIFHNTGYPFSVGDNNGTILYGGNGALAQQIDNNFNHHCGGGNHTTSLCDFASHFTSSTDYGQQGRNQLFGPNYTDFDIDIAKGFRMPNWESARLKVGVQLFNAFNHPNFQIPLADVNNGSGCTAAPFDASNCSNGLIYTTANTPTSILGAFLGGDASPRLIQLKGTFTF